MGSSNSTLMPYIFTALKNNAGNCITFDDLYNSAQDMMVRDHKDIYSNLPKSIEDAIQAGERIGIFTVNGTMIIYPVNGGGQPLVKGKNPPLTSRGAGNQVPKEQDGYSILKNANLSLYAMPKPRLTWMEAVDAYKPRRRIKPRSDYLRRHAAPKRRSAPTRRLIKRRR